MSFFRPRSIMRLILLGFAAVAIPLIAAVVIGVVKVDRLAQTGQQAVLDAEAATRQSRAIVENLTGMERSLGQYYVLSDRDFFLNYLARRKAFKAAADQLANLDIGKSPYKRLMELLAEEQNVNQRLLGTNGQLRMADTTVVSPAFAVLHDHARNILTESSQRIAYEANKTREASAELQRTLLLLAAAVVPVTIVLACVFVVLITRPLRQIDNEIRRLGSGRFDEVVSVRGPQDLQELGKRLDWLRRRVLELEEQKTAFLRHISHELKTPLTSIREGAELMLDERTRGLNEEQKEIVSIMRDSSQQLQRLIEDLLEFGKKQTPGLEPRHEAVPFERIVRRALESHSLGRTAKQLTFDLQLTPATLAGDENQLRVIVDNLLTNAIKYTPAGGKICIALTMEDEGLALEVTDSGPGIDPEERQRVFEPFYQGRALYVGPVQGTGLGLTIAQQYVHAHGGRIEILESPTGSGARIRVFFPLPQATPAEVNHRAPDQRADRRVRRQAAEERGNSDAA
jgi:two-component system sensor histidine kinase GlrK